MRLRLARGGAGVTLDDALRAVALLAGLLLTLHGVAYFVVGLAPGRSAHPSKQYGWASVCLAAGYYLLMYAL